MGSLGVAVNDGSCGSQRQCDVFPSALTHRLVLMSNFHLDHILYDLHYKINFKMNENFI